MGRGEKSQGEREGKQDGGEVAHRGEKWSSCESVGIMKSAKSTYVWNLFK